MFSRAVHYLASDEPLGKVLSEDAEVETCPVVSAGHQRHEYTTGTSFEKIIDQFKYRVGVSESGLGLIDSDQAMQNE